MSLDLLHTFAKYRCWKPGKATEHRQISPKLQWLLLMETLRKLHAIVCRIILIIKISLESFCKCLWIALQTLDKTLSHPSWHTRNIKGIFAENAMLTFAKHNCFKTFQRPVNNIFVHLSNFFQIYPKKTFPNSTREWYSSALFQWHYCVIILLLVK